jgi:hypothetical protein
MVMRPTGNHRAKSALSAHASAKLTAIKPYIITQAFTVSSCGLDTAPARQSGSREVPWPRANAECRNAAPDGRCILRQETVSYFQACAGR